MIHIKRRIYTLKGLPPEVVAVAFAKCSRSPEPFDQIAAELNEDTSRKFHEKWIVGYGHSSVAEHAVLSLALEGVSILATKVIEDNRLASYTEKSTRYQVFDRNTYYKPRRILESGHGALYTRVLNNVMDTYTRLLPPVLSYCEKKCPNNGVPEALHRMRLKNMACDACRYLLPVATQTNLGMTVNARQLEHAIVKLLSHPLDEMQEIGRELKAAALEVTPTLVKYTLPNEYLIKSSEALAELAGQLMPEDAGDEQDVRLVHYDRDAEDRLAAALLYRFSNHPYAQIMARVKKMPDAEKERLIDQSLRRLGKHDRPLRELEHISYTFDILIDYGAFRDIQRHRIATQTNQACTALHGYSVPDTIVEAGFEADYRQAMDDAGKAYQAIHKDLPHDAQYAVPLGYRKRVLFTWNLRELFHFIRLRTGPTAHTSYKRVAQKVYKLIHARQPLLARYITCHT